MFDKLSIDHITNPKQGLENSYNSRTRTRESNDEIEIPPLCAKDIFFKPYESTNEFLYCAEHTIMPALLLIAAAIISPYMLILIPAAILSICSILTVFGLATELCGYEQESSLFFAEAENLCISLSQMTIDMLVLPASILVMLTRSFATGLDKASIRIVESDPNAAVELEPLDPQTPRS